MTFISYAQNFEDVMLWRALKHVECGFYIDVGANDPEMDSVTKAFYDHGWRGINIEPVIQWYEKLQENRVRDINLQLAAGAEKGELAFYELPDTGLSTFEKATAERHQIEHGYTIFERIVPVETLTAICERFHMAPIHFLKIDVEGAEKNVLVGLDLSIIRPWIILVESTLPSTRLEDYTQWDPIILAANYAYVYFDGLNRFYVAQEHENLKAHFRAPPNVFDGFMLSGLASHPFYKLIEAKAQEQEQRAVAAEGRAQEQEQRAVAAEAQRQEQQARIDELAGNTHHWWLQACTLEADRNAIRQSWSWRITAPVRWVGGLVIYGTGALRRGANEVVRVSINIFQRPLAGLMRIVLSKPALSERLNRILLRYPPLHQQLLGVAQRGGVMLVVPAYRQPVVLNTESREQETPEALSQLPPRARKIYHNLKSAIDNRRKDND